MLYNQDYGQHRDTVTDWMADVDRAINVLNNERNFDYGQHRDEVSDWQADRGYYTDLYNMLYGQDYNQYRDTVGDWQNDRGYYADLYNMLYNQDYNQFADTRSYNEGVRQFNESLDWDKMSEDKKYAATYAMQILANGEMPSKSLLKAAGLSEKDAKKMMADLEEMVVAPSGGGGGGSGKTILYADVNGHMFTVENGKAQAVSQETINKNPGKYLVDDKTYRFTSMGQSSVSGVKDNNQTGKNGESNNNIVKDKKLVREKMN